MKTKLIFCLALVLSGGLFGCSTTNEPIRQHIVSHGSSERPDVLSYSKPSPETLRQIKVENISLTKEELNKLDALSKNQTENGVRWLVEEKPDTMRNGPWNTQIYIFNRDNTNHCVRVELIDHAGSVDHTWLNDKMLFVRVWFGRIAWTDFILDTETRKFVYIEDGRLDAVLDSQEKQ
jgi:hypothetical protein